MSQSSEYSDSESRKDVESEKTSKQTSEGSESDVEYEKRSKRKHDESKSQSVSVSVSASVSEHSADRQEGTKEQESMKSTPHEKQATNTYPLKEAAADEVSQTPKEVTGSKPSGRRRFVSMFSYEDDKEILKALSKSGYTVGSKEFWERVGQTLKLSIEVDRIQLYGRIRRLKDVYFKGLKNKPSSQERKLYQLSDDIWKGAPKGKAPRKKARKAAAQEDAPRKKARKAAAQEEEELDNNNNNNNNYDVKLDAFVRGLHNDVKFPVAESLEVVPVSKRSILQKKWNDLNGHMFNIYKIKIDLIQETMEAVVSSPSFPSL